MLNSFGYYGVFIGLEINNNQETTKRLASDEYSGSDAIIVKLPVTLPYSNNDPHYQAVDGKFIVNDTTFRLVKKRMMNDTLYLICVKDVQAGKIRQELKDFVNTFAGQSEDQKNVRHFNFIKDYIPFSIEIKSVDRGWLSNIQHQCIPIDYCSSYQSEITHPPSLI